MKDFQILSEGIKDWYLNLTQPVVNFFIRLEINPNLFTTLGFIVSVISAFVYGAGSYRIGGVLILLGGTFDIIDGRVARATERVTKFGALYDATLDRYAEVIVFFGLGYYFVDLAWTGEMNAYLAFTASMAVFLSLGGSVMVSYVRARAEGLGFECKVGIMQRPERIVLIGLSSLLHVYFLILALMVVAVLSNYTAIQRLIHIWVQDNKTKGRPQPDSAAPATEAATAADNDSESKEE